MFVYRCDRKINSISSTLHMSMNMILVFTLAAVLQAFAADMIEDDSCEHPASEDTVKGSALIQVRRTQTCSWRVQAGEDGSKPCASLLERSDYVSGSKAPLDEAGYQSTAKLCCHHEMSLFVRREIARQGFDVCDLSDLHGFVHWYDCNNDGKTFAQMQAEIGGIMGSECAWLGKLPNCPRKGDNCRDFKPCQAPPADSLDGSTALLNEEGYAGVAKRCCHTEMEKFIRREIDAHGFSICDEGSLQGFLHWFDCTNDGQSYEKLKAGIVMARTGLPPLCPWLRDTNGDCPPKGHNCPVVEIAEPEAHRRRTSCR